MHTCELCREKNAELFGTTELTFRVDCKTCGTFRITQQLQVALKNDQWAAPLRPRVSWVVRAASDAGEIITLNTDNFEQLARDVHVPSVPQKLFRLLEEFARTNRPPGAWIPLLPEWTGQAAARVRCTRAELDYYIESLADRALLRRGASAAQGCQITPDGWEALEPIVGAGRPGVCFVAMSFNPQYTPAYEQGIKPAIEEDCGLKALRVDREEHNEQITDKSSLAFAPLKSSLRTSPDSGRESISRRGTRSVSAAS